MRRAVTMTFIAGWFGFLVVSSAMAIAAVLSVAEIAIPAPAWMSADVERLSETIRRSGNGAVLAAMAEGLLFLMIAAMLVLGAWFVRSDAETDRRIGERLAASCFVAAGLVYGAIALAGVPVASATATPWGFGFVVAGSLLALALDRLTEIEETPDDDRDFMAAATLLGRRLAQDAVSAKEAEGRDERR